MNKVLLTLLFLSVIIATSQAAKKKTNCRFKCYRWKRCMKQLVGNGVRPGELGNTGIIVLTKCDMGVCDCNQATVQKPNSSSSKTKTKVTPQKPRNFGSSAGQSTRQRSRLPTSTNRNRSPDHEESSSGSESSGFIRRPFRNLLRSRLQPTTTSSTTEKPTIVPDAAGTPREVKFTDDMGRVRTGQVTGTSVSSSVSVSTSTSNNDEDNKDDQEAQNLEEPKFNAADLLMQRLRLYAQKRTRRF